MGEWHEHLYEEDEDMGESTADAKRGPNDMELYQCFMERLRFAETKHPVFAEGPYEGIAQVEAELGEAVQSLVKGEPEDRWLDEMLDVLVTAWRFARKDWE